MSSFSLVVRVRRALSLIPISSRLLLVQVYAALLVKAITEIEDDNVADVSMVAPEDDRADYRGWIIDDFPNSAEQVLLVPTIVSNPRSF